MSIFLLENSSYVGGNENFILFYSGVAFSLFVTKIMLIFGSKFGMELFVVRTDKNTMASSDIWMG